jgi:hypothetical protein
MVKLFLVTVATAMLFSGCSRQPVTVVFRFQNGYNGLVRVSEDHTNGVTVRGANGKYTIEVPESGWVRLKSLALLTEWHKEEAQFQNGTPLGYVASGSSTENVLYGLPTVGGYGCFYFVGTSAEYDKVSKKYDFYKLPLGTKLILD